MLRVLEQEALSEQPAAQAEKEPPARPLAGHIGTVPGERGGLSQDTGTKFSQRVEDKRKARPL
jgi:hypothetical protein